MEKQKHPMLWRWLCAALLLICAAEGVFLYRAYQKAPAPEPAALYEAAVRDAAFADEDEIMPLVELTRESDLVTWDAAGERVLLFSWHGTPDAYREGDSIAASEAEIWAFTDREMIRWYRENKAGVKDWTLRLEQLIGLPVGSGCTHVSAFLVRPEDVVRPAYVTDITAQMLRRSQSAEDTAFARWHKTWFDANTLFSYYESAYPWTRLGYTYDWADNGREYGLSEFLILPGSALEITFTKSTQDFIAYLENQ